MISADTAVSMSLYFTLWIGILLAFYDGFTLLGKIAIKKRSLRERYMEHAKESGLNEHLNKVIGMTVGKKMTAKEYKVISALIFFTVWVSFVKVLGVAAVFAAAFITLIPYAVLRLKLETVRNQVSTEAEQLVLSILNHYKMSHKNIYMALEHTINTGTHIKATRKILFQLLIEIRDTKNKEKIKIAIDKFSGGLKTNWSNMLGQCIYAAASDGIDVTRPMEDLSKQLMIARRMSEEKKRLNSESGRIIKYLIPFSYIGSIFVSVQYLGVPLSSLMNLQFKTQEGMWLFLMIIFLFIGNQLILFVEKNNRFDD